MFDSSKIFSANLSAIGRTRTRMRFFGSSALTNNFRLDTFEQRILLSADFAPVEARLDLPGERDVYNFTLEESRRFIFDTHGAPNGARWFIDRPSDDAPDWRDFTGSDANGRPDRVIELNEGDHSLVVEGGTETGQYGFRLIDLETAEPLTPDQAQDTTLEAQGRASEIFSFDGRAGERLYFDQIDGFLTQARVTVVDPQGEILLSAARFQDTPLPTLQMDGTHRVLIEGPEDATAEAELRFALRPVTERVTAYTPGDTARGTDAGADTIDVLTFTLAEAGTYVFDRIDAPSIPSWSLEGPDGALVTDADTQDTGLPEGAAGLYLSAGEWRFIVDARAGTDWALRLAGPDQCTNHPADTETPLTLPTDEERAALFTLHGQAQTRYTLSIPNFDGNLRRIDLRVIGPDGTEL